MRFFLLSLAVIPALASAAERVVVQSGDLINGPTCIGFRENAATAVTKARRTEDSKEQWIIEYWSVAKQKPERRMMWYRDVASAETFFKQRLEKLNMHLTPLRLVTCVPVPFTAGTREVALSAGGAAATLRVQGGRLELVQAGKSTLVRSPRDSAVETVTELFVHPLKPVVMVIVDRELPKLTERIAVLVTLDAPTAVAERPVVVAPEPAVPEPPAIVVAVPIEVTPEPPVVIETKPALPEPPVQVTPEPVVPEPPAAVVPEALVPDPPLAVVPEPALSPAVALAPGFSPARALGVRPSALSFAWYEKPTRCIGMSLDGSVVVTGVAPGGGADRVIIRSTGAETKTLFASAGPPLAGYRAALPFLGPALAEVAPLECVPATRRGSEWLLAFRGEPVLVSMTAQGDQVKLSAKASGRRAIELGVLGLRDASEIVGVWSHPVLPRFVVVGGEDGDEIIRWFDYGKAAPGA